MDPAAIKPDGTAWEYEAGRFEVARHLEFLRQAGFVSPTSLHHFEAEIDNPTPAQNYLFCCGEIASSCQCYEAMVSGDRVNPSGGDIRNPATLHSRERQVDGSDWRFSAQHGWAETNDEDAGRGGGDATASCFGLGHAADC
ncbi:MAG: hypothetical protein ACJ8AW_47950, partial [Rhodopila sp.]